MSDLRMRKKDVFDKLGVKIDRNCPEVKRMLKIKNPEIKDIFEKLRQEILKQLPKPKSSWDYNTVFKVIEFYERKIKELNSLDEKKELEDKIIEIMTNWNRANFTVCPECHVDDWVHVEGCKFTDDNIITRLTKFILSREQELQKQNRELKEFLADLKILITDPNTSYPSEWKDIPKKYKEDFKSWVGDVKQQTWDDAWEKAWYNYHLEFVESLINEFIKELKNLFPELVGNDESKVK